MSEGEKPAASSGRQAGRMKLSIPCEIKGEKEPSRVPVRDISLDGCRVLSAHSTPAGEALQLTLRLPAPLELAAEVRWVEEDPSKKGFILGCRFVHTPESRRSLQDALKGLASAIDSAARRVK